MKLIIAVIQPHRLEAVKQALADVEVFRLTVMDVQGFGRQRGQTEVYRGHEFAVNLLRKVQLMIAVNEEFLEPTIDAIIRGGRSGASGRDRRRQNLCPAAGGLHPHPHGRERRRSNLSPCVVAGRHSSGGTKLKIGNSKSETKSKSEDRMLQTFGASDFLFAIFSYFGFHISSFTPPLLGFCLLETPCTAARRRNRAA